jgi:hypothetical protein
VFLGQHAPGQAGLVIVGLDRHRRLGDDGAAVQRRGHEMHAAAMQPHPGGERLGMGLHPGKGRQQRGMDVQHAALEAAHEGVAEDAHEAGQQHQVRRMALDLGGQRGVELLARGKAAMVDRHRDDPARLPRRRGRPHRDGC